MASAHAEVLKCVVAATSKDGLKAWMRVDLKVLGGMPNQATFTEMEMSASAWIYVIRWGQRVCTMCNLV